MIGRMLGQTQFGEKINQQNLSYYVKVMFAYSYSKVTIKITIVLM